MHVKKLIAAGSLVGMALLGGAVGAGMIGTSNAATTSPTATTSNGSGTAGKWHSNTDPAHEANESPERAAAEAAADASGVAPSFEGGAAAPATAG